MARSYRQMVQHLDHDPEARQLAGMRMDADTPGPSIFVERALLFIMTEVFNTLIPPLKGMKFVPRRSTTDPGAKSVAYKQYTRAGIAQWITNYGHDLPSAAVWVKEFTHPIFPLGASYRYTIFDLLAAAMASSREGGPPLNIDLEQARAAMIAIEKKLDNVARVGSADGLSPALGLLGLLNNPNAQLYTIPNGASGSQLWSTKTPDEIAKDVHGIANAQRSTTFEIHAPDSIIVPIAQYGILSTTRMGDGSNMTIKQFILETSDYIKSIDSWQYAKGAGAGSTDRMVAYSRNPSYVWQEVPVEFRQEAPQLVNLEVKVPCWAKSGGVIIPYPLSVSYGDGI